MHQVQQSIQGANQDEALRLIFKVNLFNSREVSFQSL